MHLWAPLIALIVSLYNTSLHEVPIGNSIFPILLRPNIIQTEITGLGKPNKESQLSSNIMSHNN